MNKVIKGKQGYLFLAGNRNAVIEQHTGRQILGKQKLARWKKLFRKRQCRLWLRRCKYFIQIVPDKHHVYSQYLPDGTTLATHRNIDRLIETLPRGLHKRFSYPGEALRQASMTEQVYYRKDTHWTDKGAYTGYRLLMDMINRDFPDAIIIKDPVYTPGKHQGDLARMSDLRNEEIYDICLPAHNAGPVFDNKITGTGKIQVFQSGAVNNSLTAMVFGSSSTTMLMKFLKGSFNTVIFCWSPALDYSLIDYFSPSLVISQIRERHLIQPADDGLGLTTTEIAFVKSFMDFPGTGLPPLGYNPVELLLSSLAKAGAPVNRRHHIYIEQIAWTLGLMPVLQQAMRLHDSGQTWYRIRRNIDRTFTHLCKEISSSELFDPVYIKSNLTSCKQPLQDNHIASQYLLLGSHIGYRSGPGFNGELYWEKYPDVRQAGIHPLIHYIRHGKKEGRQLLR